MRGRLPQPLVVAALVTAMAGPTTALAQRPVVFPVADDFGYVAYSSEPAPVSQCAVSFVDISATGSTLTVIPSGADPALDDGGAILALVEPITLYGTTASSLVVSTNGYLAVTSSLLADAGGDFSGDCPLPAIPQPGPGVAARIAVLHADLTGVDTLGPGSDGTILAAYFASCPRPSEALGDEPCTVVQWQSWAVRGTPGAFSFQAVLYHRTFEVVYQYGPGAPFAAPTAGVQSGDARHGLAPLCAAPFTSLAGTALCFFEPRFPAGGPLADIAVEIAEKSPTVAAGSSLDYLVDVVNPGPSPMTGVTVSSVVPPELAPCTWTCSATGGSTCTAAGSGGIADTVDLEPDTAATYAMTCTLSLGTGGSSVTVTASATEPTDVTDPDGANNTASVTTEIPIPVTLQRFTVD